MNKKGFTLVELLAVIVILAIIALIASGITLNMVDKSKKIAARSSAFGFIESIEKSNELSQMDSLEYPYYEDGTYTSISDFNNLKMKGKKPDSINLTITNRRVSSAELCINNYKVIYDGNDTKQIIKGCDSEIVEDNPIDNPTTNPEDNEQNNEPEKKEPTEYSKNSSPYVLYDFNNTTNGSLNNITGSQITSTAKNINITNKGIAFNGSNSYIEFGKQNAAEFTYEVTFIPRILTSESIIIGNLETGGCSINLLDNSTEKNLFGTCHIDGEYQRIYYKNHVEINKMYNATLSYDGSNLRFYVNGELSKEEKYDTSIKQPDKDTVLMIGANPLRNTADSNFFNGLILSARYYKEALSEEEVRDNNTVVTNRFKDVIETLPSAYNKINKDGLLVYYDSKFNTKIGHINEYTMLDNLVSETYNTTLKNTSIVNNEFIFNGTSSYIPISKINTPNITYEAVFKQEEYKDSAQNILSNQESGGCAIRTINQKIDGYCVINKTARILSYENFKLNEYYHVALTFDGSNLKLYVNGQYVTSYSSTSGITYPINNTILMLGNNPNGSSAALDFFKGKIKMTRIYNVALTEEQILNNYNTDKKIHSELK